MNAMKWRTKSDSIRTYTRYLLHPLRVRVIGAFTRNSYLKWNFLLRYLSCNIYSRVSLCFHLPALQSFRLRFNHNKFRRRIRELNHHFVKRKFSFEYDSFHFLVRVRFGQLVSWFSGQNFRLDQFILTLYFTDIDPSHGSNTCSHNFYFVSATRFRCSST